MSTMKVQELLKGYVVDRGNIQSVGNMTVIPILAEQEFTDVADIHDVTLKRDSAYNELEFKNSSGKIGIALQGWTMIDPQPAQDRTIPYGHLISAGSDKKVPANCVQARQGGHFNTAALNQENFMILPPSLRSVALQKSSYRSSDYSALWSTLKRWSNGMDCESNGLQMFYSKHKDKLAQFVAQFEPVEKQLGAIVIINGNIMAVDIMPKYSSWKSTWRALIRDSYGAEAVRLADAEKAKVPSIDITGIKNWKDLKKSYQDTTNEFYGGLEAQVGELASIDVSYNKLESINELAMLKLDHSQFRGQGVLHGDQHFIYLSLVSTSMKSTTTKKRQFQSLRHNPYGDSGFFFRG